MQKLVYLSNSRDFTEQGDINENKYFTRVNKLLEQGWKIANIVPNERKLEKRTNPTNKETFAAFVLLEKPEDNTKA